jgi:hypothetical protein
MSQEPGARAREPGLFRATACIVNEIYKTASRSREPGLFLKGAGAENREPVKKGTDSPTLITMIETKKFYCRLIKSKALESQLRETLSFP